MSMTDKRIKCIGASGRVSLPFDMRQKYKMVPGAPVRITDTGDGILVQTAAMEDIVDPNTKPTISKDAAHAIVAGCRNGSITPETLWSEITHIVHGGK